MATINFLTIPTLRIPGVFSEVDASQANGLQIPQRTLLIGQKLSGGTATADVAVIASNVADAKVQFGVGSMLVSMYNQYRITDPTTEVWFLPVADNGGGAAATGTITFGSSGSATDVTANGALSLYIAGVSVAVGVITTNTNTVIATAVAAAINAKSDLCVTAAASTNIVTVTSRHKGIAAMDCDIRLNYLGYLNSEAIPPGLSVTIVAMSGGTLDPDITTGLANLTSTTFDFIALPYTGSANLNLFQTFIAGRWGYTEELFGGGFTAVNGTFSTLVSWGNARNDMHLSCLGVDSSPTPAYLIAADYCAACAGSLIVDPALPLGGAGDGVTMNWLAPPIAKQFSFSERNTLLYDGISTYLVEQGGRVRVEYAISTYQSNGSGQPDNSWLDVETGYTLQYLVRLLRDDLASKFSRKKLIANGARISAGSNFTTAQIVLNEAIALYNLQAAQGMCQNPDEFAKNAYAVNPGNGTVQLYLPIQLANQLRRIEMMLQFTKP